MTYDFRVRATLGAPVMIASSEAELEVFRQEDVRVVIRSTADDLPLTDSRVIVIRGSGYPTEENARREGDRWHGHVMVAFSSLTLGADFGEREPEGGFTEAGLQLFRDEAPGYQHFNDSPGVQPLPRIHQHSSMGPKQQESVAMGLKESCSRSSEPENMTPPLTSCSVWPTTSSAHRSRSRLPTLGS